MRTVFFYEILQSIKKFSLSAVLFLTALTAFSENFRVRKVLPIAFSEIDEKLSVESGINDALFITLPVSAPDFQYVSGVELNLKIPEEIIKWQDSVAYMLYENLEPLPDSASKNLNFYGERLHVATISANFSLTLYVPVSSDFAIKNSPYSVRLPALSSAEKNGIFLRFMMVMKGVPESLEDSIIEISAKPVLKNQGALNLTVNLPPSSSSENSAESAADEKYSVFIDDIPVNDYSNKILATGEHHLSIVSDSFRNELRTFRIEQAKTMNLAVNLRGVEPLLKIVCPNNIQVFLDGAQIPVSSEPVAVTQGEHTVRFVFGDYEVVKTLSAQKGRTYSVNLNVDASISEEN